MPPSARSLPHPVVGAVHHDGVVGDAEFVEPFEQRAHHVIVFHHAVGVKADAGPSLRRGLEMGPKTSIRVVLNQTKNGFFSFTWVLMNVFAAA